MKKNIIIVIIFYFFTISCEKIEFIPKTPDIKQEITKDDVYNFEIDKDFQYRNQILNFALPMIADYCKINPNSPIKSYQNIPGTRKRSKRLVGISTYYVMVDSQLQWTEFSFTNLRTSISYGIIRAAGLNLKKQQYLSTEEQLAYINRSSDIDILSKAFKKVFGVDLISKKVQRDTQIENLVDVLVFYNPKALEIAFKKLYLRPENLVSGIKMQSAYDIIFKEYVRDYTFFTAVVLENSGFLDNESVRYLEIFENDTRFEEKDFSHAFFYNSYEHRRPSKLSKSLIKSDIKFNSKRFGFTQGRRLIGTILRRKIDGTLPIILKILRTILKDYDSALYTLIGPYLYEK